ncbi:hypothetical protein [Oscillatoria sp. FACHB-1406]|uniref:hypothetical protein n=1 Tax=Oscillatoria sp. FACHB-1406 TaxID=2692846 RepID=UPI00168A3C02|nr:hypothetical protein [Oscillatoria sp. FACHB-1406]MBD2576702.1 hypothetical protein [Oscillatoria sp. FACHB-1406]
MDPTSSSFISLELPQPLARSLQAYQQQHAIDSPASAILSILEQFFAAQGNSPGYATQEQLQQLEAKVDRLTASIALLPPLPPQYPTTASNPAPPPLPRSSATFAFLCSEDDIDDEPDEILYDFQE